MVRGDPFGPSTSRVKLPDHSIDWYRTKLDPETHKRIHHKSDLHGAAQTLGFLGMLALWLWLAVRLQVAGRPGLAMPFVLLYGMQSNFCINGMHELGHGHVFRTRWLNGFFCRVISFLGWLHPDMFFSSRLRGPPPRTIFERYSRGTRGTCHCR